MSDRKVILFVTEDWFFCSHFLDRAVAAKKSGYEVSVVTRVREHGEQIAKAGLKLIPLELARRGINPLAEWRIVRQLVKIYRVERPALVHHVALKPIVYGTIAARLAKVRAIVNAPVGMGYVFSSPSWKARLIRPSIEFAYSLLMNPQGSCVIFENPDDHELLVSKGMVRQEQSVIIRGAGVDLKRFGVTPDPEGAPVVILPARMLWDKGTGEFAEAARMLKQQGTDARFVLVGDVDLGNLAAVPRAQLENWRDSGIVEWWGHRDDMPKVYAEANIVCLPSYREGLPKTLIEAAASGRPIVATDVPGCREVVRNGDNGLLVCAHDSIALADALRTLIDDRSLRQRMGAAGRKRAEAEFGVERVSAETLRIYEQMLA